MNLACVVGKVWATRKAANLDDATLLVIQPMNGDRSFAGDRLAAIDIMGCAQGQFIYFVTSKEAALPLKNPLTPVDACIVGIADRVDRV
jgi:ethanolamine utilization protein EutN